MRLLCLLLVLFHECFVCRSGQCPEPFKKSNGECLYAGAEDLAWFEASQSCKSLNSEADLVSVDSLQHAEKLMKFFEEETGSLETQIGAVFFRDSLYWLDGSVGVPGDDAFVISEPIDEGSCFSLKKTASGEMELQGGNCLTVRLPYLCGIPGKEPPPQQGGFDCPEPFQKSRGMCLWVSDDEQAWFSAAQSCRTFGPGAELKSVESLKQARKLLKFVEEETGSPVALVGAYFSNNDYYWTNGDQGIPNGDDFVETGLDLGFFTCIALREAPTGEIELEKVNCITAALPYLCGRFT